MATVAPVWGLRPSRGRRARTRKLPNPRNSTWSPASRASMILCQNSCTTVSACRFGHASVAATCSTSLALVMPVPLCAGPALGRNEMDPPLCGSAAMSHNEFQSSEPMEPQEASPMKQEIHVLGIDIAKHVFHAVGMDDRGNVVYRKRLSRHDLIPFLAKLPPVRIGLEACGGAHDWARCFRA